MDHLTRAKGVSQLDLMSASARGCATPKHLRPSGHREHPGSPGCHEESKAWMVKVNSLTLSAFPFRLKQTVVSVARPTNISATNRSQTQRWQAGTHHLM